MRQIPISDINGVRIGCAEDQAGKTGCTVLLCGGADGAPAGVDVRGGGPASREPELLRPWAAAERIHAVLLSGGSAFGLDAAGGVMRYLSERGVGFDTGIAKVPLVCASCIFDLGYGSPDARPDAGMAYAACLDAQENNRPRCGSFGAGTGATVGKLGGTATMMKAGQGFFAVQAGDLQVGAAVVVNALGDIFDPDTHERVAGMRTPDGKGFADSTAVLCRDISGKGSFFTGNTTIAAIVTNAAFDKTQLTKIASMAQNGLARAIDPVHTTADGDSVYALSVGSLRADINVVGTLAAHVLAHAIVQPWRRGRA